MPWIKRNWLHPQVVERDPYRRSARHDRGGEHTQKQLKAGLEADGAVRPRVGYLHEANGFGRYLHPCNSAARDNSVVSEVEEVVAVCVDVSVETWAGAALEEVSACALSVCIGWDVAVQLAVSMRKHKWTIRSIPMRAGVPASPMITTKDARPVTEPHFSCKYQVCPAIGNGLPLVPRMAWW